MHYIYFVEVQNLKLRQKLKLKNSSAFLLWVHASNLLPVQANACTDLQLPAQTCIDLHLASATAPLCVCFSYCSCVWMVTTSMSRSKLSFIGSWFNSLNSFTFFRNDAYASDLSPALAFKGHFSASAVCC